MKSKIYSILLLFAVISCNKQNPIEKIIITKPDEHWVCYNSNSAQFADFKFNKDKMSHRCKRNSKGELKDNAVEVPQKWDVTRDSILTWESFTYNVVSYTNNSIILTFPMAKEPFVGYIFLIKQKDNEVPIRPGLFKQKRIKHPDKYR